MRELLNQLRKHFFYLRKGGFRELLKYYKLNKFEKKIFTKKKLIWNNLGYWQVDPMPTVEELNKFYSEIYWLNNKYYKNILVTPRDLNHFTFLQNNILSKLHEKTYFMNFGAGHGGISYLLASKNFNIINIEPSNVSSFNFKNFKNYNNLENFLKENDNSSKIDILYSSHTVEHLSEPIHFFKNILKILKDDALVFIEVPNCRKTKINSDYAEGGCDGKITGSHLIYFTSDFFNKIKSKIFLFKDENDGKQFTEVNSEDEADCIRAIIKTSDIRNWVEKYNLS